MKRAQYAACRDHEPELFQPASESEGFQGQIQEARAVCRACDALWLCRAWALGPTGPEAGILAGLTALERVKIRRKRSRARLEHAKRVQS